MFTFLVRMRYLAGTILFLASLYGYRLVRVGLSEHERIREQLTQLLARRAIDELMSSGRDSRVCVAPLTNDEAFSLTKRLREWVHRHGGHDADWWTRMMESLDLARPAATIDDARDFARSSHARFVVLGRVRTLKTVPGKSCLEAELRLFDTESGKLIERRAYAVREPCDRQCDATSRFLSAALTQRRWKQTGVWTMVILLIPIASYRPLSRILRWQSNRANMTTLGVYGGVVLVTGWLLLTCPKASWLTCVLLVTGTLGSLAYFGYFCSQIEQIDG